MRRLDQGHLHLKLEVPRLTAGNRTRASAANTLKIEPIKQLVNSCYNIYI
jgi:hypothetical protein